MKRYVLAAVVAGVLLSVGGELAHLVAGSVECDSATTQCGDIALSHEEAMLMCDDLGLIYSYEAEGYTTAEFCVTQELFNAQQEADHVSY